MEIMHYHANTPREIKSNNTKSAKLLFGKIQFCCSFLNFSLYDGTKRVEMNTDADNKDIKNVTEEEFYLKNDNGKIAVKGQYYFNTKKFIV